MSTPIKRALLSVTDKTGLVEFAKNLSKLGIEILSTGGSAKVMRDAGVMVIDVSEHTGFPEIMGGRVKTLQPSIHGGLLAVRDNPDHVKAMVEHNIKAIDLLAVNLYAFEATVAGGANFDQCIENIDIGGPAMIRAAAKNHQDVTVVVDPTDYDTVIQNITDHKGSTNIDFRKQLASKAYARTAAYDAAISTWFANQLGDTFPSRLNIGGEIKQTLRYGENPHQQAAFYTTTETRPGVATAKQIQGKELSFNNLNDTDAAFELIAEFDQAPACAIIKHANPCGVAMAENLTDAYRRALATDTESAFGGIVAFNQTVDAATAEHVAKLFAEVVIAPEIDDQALAILSKKKNLRVLITGGMPDARSPTMTVRSLSGGLLLQQSDSQIFENLDVVTERQPTDQELNDLKFAFTVGKHVKSNAIIYAKNNATVGVGAGQMSRVNSSRIAAWKAADAARVAGDNVSWATGSVVASDAFFPFADGLLAAADAGATAIIQPGGSIRDDDVIQAANDKGLAMVFTGMRHFRH